MNHSTACIKENTGNDESKLFPIKQVMVACNHEAFSQIRSLTSDADVFQTKCCDCRAAFCLTSTKRAYNTTLFLTLSHEKYMTW